MDETAATPKQANNKMMPIVGGIVILLVIAGIFLFMQNGQSEQMESPVDQAMPASEESTEGENTNETEVIDENTQMMDEGKMQVIEVEAGSFYYKPNVIKVKQGEKVRIVMKAVSMMHDFNIDELGVKLPIVQNGETGMVEFVADTIGTFEYYCSVADHRAKGQIGTITIE